MNKSAALFISVILLTQIASYSFNEIQSDFEQDSSLQDDSNWEVSGRNNTTGNNSNSNNDSHCLTLGNFSINSTYFVAIDLINTCNFGINYPGINASADNSGVSGFYNGTSWWYVIEANGTYNLVAQLEIDSSVFNGTNITLDFEAAILNCGTTGTWHDCPDSYNSTFSHQFTYSNSTVANNSTTKIVPDYYFDDYLGFKFNQISNIMNGTYVPTTVTIVHGGDEVSHNHGHMLAVTFHTNGHSEEEFTRYLMPPSHNESIEITEEIYITNATTHVEVSMDVVTCLNETCDLSIPVNERFQVDEPKSHRSLVNDTQGFEWSAPGKYGENATHISQRRPMLEDSNWCNNRMTSLEFSSAIDQENWGRCYQYGSGVDWFLSTNQYLPNVVELSDEIFDIVPRTEEEQQNGKEMPRFSFEMEEVDLNGEMYYRIVVIASQVDLPTHHIFVRVYWSDDSGEYGYNEWNLADTNGVYGFYPGNSDSTMTFIDQVDYNGDSVVSTFAVGDTIFVKTGLGQHRYNDMIQISYDMYPEEDDGIAVSAMLWALGSGTSVVDPQKEAWEVMCEEWEYWNSELVDTSLPGNGCPHYIDESSTDEDSESSGLPSIGIFGTLAAIGLSFVAVIRREQEE